jgi:hypothetical protein
LTLLIDDERSIVRVAQLAARRAGKAAILDGGIIAIDMPLFETAEIEIALDGPVWIDVEFAGKGKRARLVYRKLRGGEDRAVILIDQKNRRRANDADIIAGARGNEVKLVARRAIAKIAIKTEE